MSKEQEQFIISYFNTMSVESLRKLFNETFGTNYKSSAFYYHTQKLGLRKHTEHKYSEEEELFLQSNSSTMTKTELMELFNKTFDCNLKEDAITMHCWQRGYKAQSDGKFKEGSVPWEKTIGGKDAYMEKHRQGVKNSPNKIYWEKGNTPHNTKNIGEESIRHRNTVIKTENGWQIKQNYIWEQHYGKVPRNHVVIFADGDKTNFGIDNLRCVPNRTFIKLHRNDWLNSGKEIVDVATTFCTLENMIKPKR